MMWANGDLAPGFQIYEMPDGQTTKVGSVYICIYFIGANRRGCKSYLINYPCYSLSIIIYDSNKTIENIHPKKSFTMFYLFK